MKPHGDLEMGASDRMPVCLASAFTKSTIHEYYLYDTSDSDETYFSLLWAPGNMCSRSPVYMRYSLVHTEPTFHFINIVSS